MSSDETSYDVAVLGAGVGGTCAAICLSKRGARVLLIEAGQFPRHKVCGEFLSPESLAIFARVGVLQEILDAGAQPISRAAVVTETGKSVVTQLPAAGLALSRFRLDKILWRAAQSAGVLGLTNTRVRNVRRDGTCFSIETSRAEFHATTAIDATGRARLSAHTASERNAAPRFLGLKAHFRGARIETDLVELHFWQGGYCGLVGIEEDICNVCLLTRYDRRDAGKNAPGQIWERVLASCPALRERLREAVQVVEWQTTANVQFAGRAPVDANGILRVGDAAGYIHPLTGDGMAMAARSGELAAAVIKAQLRGSLSTSVAAQLYEAAWRREFERRLRAGDVLGRALLSPPVAAALLGVLARRPREMQRLVRLTRGAVI